MTYVRTFVASISLAAVLGGALVGCDNKPDNAGDAMKKASDKVEAAADKVEDKTKAAADKVEDKTKDAADKVTPK